MRWSPEELVQLECVNFTRIMCPSVLLIASMNGLYLNGGKNIGAYINKMKKLGMRTGDLDIRLHWQDREEFKNYGFVAPKTGYVELKAGRNTPTDNQLEVMAALDKIGILNGWTNSAAGYVSILKSWNVPMRTGIYAGIGKI